MIEKNTILQNKTAFSFGLTKTIAAIFKWIYPIKILLTSITLTQARFANGEFIQSKRC